MRTVDLQTAKTLQKLGYDGEYAEDIPGAKELDGELQWFPIPAPRLDDAAYWIREKYNIFVFVDYVVLFRSWTYTILNLATEEYYDVISKEDKWDMKDSYDEALEAGVKHALQIISQNHDNGKDEKD